MIRQRLQVSWQFVLYIGRRFAEDQCLRSAAALTYMSLFAVVPLMTVIYSMFSAMPAFADVGERIQDFMFQHFVPATVENIQSYLERFSGQARDLTGVGVMFLLVTAILMLKNIEQTFNAIWRTRGNRSGLSSFLLYWAVLTLGPLCIGATMAISTYFGALEIITDQAEAAGLMVLLPLLFTTSAFTLIYWAMPNTRVRLKHALLGGLIAGIAFELAKYGYAITMQRSTYTVVYGAFAAIPLFLVWIYLSWTLLLAGAELVHGLASFGSRRKRHFSDVTLLLAILELFWRRHRSGELVKEQEMMRSTVLFDRYSVPVERWETLRELLLDNHLLRVTENNHFVLGRSLSHFTLWDLVQLLELTPGDQRRETRNLESAWLDRCEALLQQAHEFNRDHLDVPLAQLFTESSDVRAQRALDTQVA